MNVQEAEAMYLEEIKKHPLLEWKFEWDQSARRFGSCRYATKRITMSIQLTTLNSREECLKTIRHEIAHALTPGHHHDYVWKMKCQEIGTSSERCYGRHVAQPPKTFEWYCPVCGISMRKFYRYADPGRRYHIDCNRGKPVTQIVYLQGRCIQQYKRDPWGAGYLPTDTHDN